MRTASLILFLAPLILIGCSPSLPDPVPAGRAAPLARITLLDGGYDSLARYQGRRVAILFWAKWCSRSRSAMNEFHELAIKYGRSNGFPSVSFVAISLDKQEDEEKYLEYIQSQNLMTGIDHAYSGNGPDDEAAHLFQIYEVPRIVLVDPSGKIELVTDDIDEVQEDLSTLSGGRYQVSSLNTSGNLIQYGDCEME